MRPAFELKGHLGIGLLGQYAASPRTAAEDADVGEESKGHDDEPHPAQATELVLRDRERDRGPRQEQEPEERPEERVERSAQVVREQPQQEDDETRAEERQEHEH